MAFGCAIEVPEQCASTVTKSPTVLRLLTFTVVFFRIVYSFSAHDEFKAIIGKIE
jgi:hypothetical protein